MGSIVVDRQNKRLNLISVKLTDRELRRVKRSLRNFRIKKDNFSDSLRVLLVRSYRCSVDYDKRLRKIEIIGKERD